MGWLDSLDVFTQLFYWHRPTTPVVFFSASEAHSHALKATAMRQLYVLSWCSWLSVSSAQALVFSLVAALLTSAKQKPNTVVMTSSGLGYNSVGWKNRQFRTPQHLDRMHREGILLDRLYTYQSPAQTRCS
jgi:hypothetical protein